MYALIFLYLFLVTPCIVEAIQPGIEWIPIKKNLHPSCFPWDIAKMLQTCYFGYFGHTWLHTIKVILSTCRKLVCLSAGKKSTSSPTFFWRYCKDMQIYNFGCFEHASRGNSMPKLHPAFRCCPWWFIFVKNLFYQKQCKYDAMNIKSYLNQRCPFIVFIVKNCPFLSLPNTAFNF